MRGFQKLAIIAAGVISLFNLPARGDQDILIKPDQPSGVYHVGDTVTWQIDAGKDVSIKSIPYTIMQDQMKPIAKGDLDLSSGHATTQATFTQPGTLLLKLMERQEPTTQPQPCGGAIADPDSIKPSSPPPDDFDAFWAEQVKKLEAVPANPVITPGDAGVPNVAYDKITLDNINSSHINGQLARPAKGEKFPALLVVQWAGVYPLQKPWVTTYANQGWLALNIEAHDLPIDEPVSFYKEQWAGPLANYPKIGNDNRETSYFLRMYLSCYRAAEYLSSRPDWDGKTLVVMGASQGGLQAIMTAGFYPGITAALAEIPAGCDMLGPDVGRRGGWPGWYAATGGKDPAKVHEASRYYDVVNFARHIKCPILVATGLVDETCPADGVVAAFNQIHSPKKLLLMPLAAHPNLNNAQVAWYTAINAWLPALAKGEPPPIGK